jgi:hypothetical protein
MCFRIACGLLAAFSASAWDTRPHQQITQAALAVLPARFGDDAAALVAVYCVLPDRFVEMDRFGFARKGWPQTADEARPYCVRPDGVIIHGLTGHEESDLGSVLYLMERVATNLSRDRTAEAARFAGVLSHFIADSLSPPHAGEVERLRVAGCLAPVGKLHSVLEKRIPEFSLEGTPGPSPGLLDGAQRVLADCREGAARNRQALEDMVAAACRQDEVTLDRYRLAPGKRAAEILARAFAVVFSMNDAR